MDAQTIVTIVTPIIVPLIIAGVKYIIPKIPTWLLPILAPILGAVLTIITNYAAQSSGNLVIAAILGLAGVGVREIVDQLKPAPVTPIETK